MWFVGIETAFSIPPGVPSGAYFSNWQVAPTSYMLPIDHASTRLAITFTEPNYYTLTAWFILQHGTARIEDTVNVLRPSISGPDEPILNTNVTYSVPTTLPPEVSFTGWTVTPNSGHTITGGTNNRSLTIKFNAARDYTLIANFSLPGDVSYSATKTVIPAPTISANASQIKLGESVTFSVNNPQSGTVYEWEANGSIVPNHTLSYIILHQPANIVFSGEIQANYIVGPIYARCRIRAGTVVSAWSNQVVVTVKSSSGGGTI